MRTSIFCLLLFMFPVAGIQASNGKADYNPLKGFSSWLPAPSPDHAMLLGNGEMGAMVFGHPHQETIIMNHAALYLPLSAPIKPINQKSRLDEIRKLILEGKATDAANIPVEISMQEGYGGQIWSDPYIPAFDIRLNISAGNIEHYKRFVNYQTGEAVVVWKQDGNAFQRRQFMSRADSIMVIEVKADTKFDASVFFERRPFDWSQWEYINKNFNSAYSTVQDGKIQYHSEFKNQNNGGLAGFNGVGKIVKHNGKLKSHSNFLEIENCDYFLMIIKIEPYRKGAQTREKAIASTLDKKSGTYEALLNAHRQVHSEIFDRVEFGLNGMEETEAEFSEVMNLKARNQVSNQTIVKRFYSARYNILSATGVNPPNLQGIWGSSYQPPWASDYTHDGNLPVAISSFLTSNMPELMQSFFDYHDARLDDYRLNAQNLYGCRGIQVPSHSSTFGYNVHFDPIWCLSYWNGGAAWAAFFYYDYWLYSRDTVFLKTRALPFMQETALFFEDFLVEDKVGKLMFNPSYSPENNPGNQASQAAINATMDVMLVKELFRNLLAVSEIVGIDKGKTLVWEEMLSKLPEYQVDADGFLREWLWPGYTENHNHRHLSHLYGMYDIIDPDIAQNKVLQEGVRKVLNEKIQLRLNENGGIMVFGLVQMAWVAANLGEASMVEKIIHMLNTHYWSDSQATYHDPGGLFNMDLSGGYQTAVIRALMQSEKGIIKLLPALPPTWESGFIKGISARGQVHIPELRWDGAKLSVKMQSAVSQEVIILLPEGYDLDKTASNRGTITPSDEKGNLRVSFKPNEIVQIHLNKL